MKENLNTGGKYSTAIFGKFSNAIDIIFNNVSERFL